MAQPGRKVRGPREVACGPNRLVFRDLIALTPLVIQVTIDSRANYYHCSRKFGRPHC